MINHVSAGGFVFHYNKDSKDISVLLVVNNNGELVYIFIDFTKSPL